MANLAKKSIKISFPYLYDPEQAVAKSYKAACTPDFFYLTLSISFITEGSLIILDPEIM